jgi:hypothetical protein
MTTSKFPKQKRTKNTRCVWFFFLSFNSRHLKSVLCLKSSSVFYDTRASTEKKNLSTPHLTVFFFPKSNVSQSRWPFWNTIKRYRWEETSCGGNQDAENNTKRMPIHFVHRKANRRSFLWELVADADEKKCELFGTLQRNTNVCLRRDLMPKKSRGKNRHEINAAMSNICGRSAESCSCYKNTPQKNLKSRSEVNWNELILKPGHPCWTETTSLQQYNFGKWMLWLC